MSDQLDEEEKAGLAILLAHLPREIQRRDPTVTENEVKNMQELVKGGCVKVGEAISECKRIN